MEQTAQRRCRWLAVCTSIAILCGASLTSALAAASGSEPEPPGETLAPTTVSPPSGESAVHGPIEASAAGGAVDYVINLESTPRPADLSSVPELPGSEHYRLYTTQFEKDGQTWHRLRLGFFASERDARQALEAVRALYPQAWIAKVSPGEAEVAAQAAIREAASPREVPGTTIPGAAASAAEDTAEVPEILTLKEAADFLRVDPLVLKDMARRQEVPSRRIGVYWRFSRSALRAWLAGADVDTAELFAAPPAVSGAVGQASVGLPGGSRQGEPLSPEAMSRITAAGTTTAAADEVPEADSEEEPIGEAPEERTAEDVLPARAARAAHPR